MERAAGSILAAAGGSGRVSDTAGNCVECGVALQRGLAGEFP
jgi:hypothetical protein